MRESHRDRDRERQSERGGQTDRQIETETDRQTERGEWEETILYESQISNSFKPMFINKSRTQEPTHHMNVYIIMEDITLN